MCLENLISKKELAEFKKALPKEFDVFKAMNHRGRPEFYQGGENQLKRKGIYKAQQRKVRRMPTIGYKPGFHAFLTERNADRYCGRVYESTLKKFRAKRSWVTAKGKADNISCIVLSKIEVV